MTSKNTPTRVRANGRRANRGRQTSPRTIAQRRKQQQAVELRAQGLTFEQIATELGYKTRDVAYRAVKSVLDRTESESVEDLRKVQDRAISKGLRAVYRVLDGQVDLPELPGDMDEEEREELARMLVDAYARHEELRLKATDRMVRLLERQARLHGLDAPVKTEIDGQTVSVVFHQALQYPDAATVVDADQ